MIRRFLLASVVCLAVLSLGAKEAPSLRQQMLSHVEKVLVVDTIVVDKAGFFRAYRLRPSAGSILSGAEVASRLGPVVMPVEFEGEPFTGFTNEFGDYMIWAQADSTGYARLAESVRLVDGTWSQPEFAPPVLNAGEDVDDDEPVEANAAFPFMLDDGQTLYFASDNPQGIGGYDLYIATKDPSDGSYLIPGNLGMPFNSPYDDYMMAVDNQTGVGWWASDRNQLDGKLTVYVFALADERVNVDPDDEDLLAYASLSGWESLLDEEQQARRQALKAEMEAIRPVDTREPEFLLPMAGGSTYRFLSDFKNRRAAQQMQLYLAQKEAYDRKEKELDDLRGRYARGDRQLAGRIQTLEQQLRLDAKSLADLLSDIYRLESQQ